MVYVRLAREWTDGEGAAHAAGDLVDVDPVTLAKLEADGVVASTDKGDGEVRAAWAGSTGADTGAPVPPVPPKPGPPQPSSGSTQPKPNWAGSTGVEV